MVVAVRIGEAEADRYGIQKGRIGQVDIPDLEIVTDMEDQLVGAAHHVITIEQRAVDPAIIIGRHAFYQRAFGTFDPDEIDMQAARGPAKGRVEDMRRQFATGQESASRSVFRTTFLQHFPFRWNSPDDQQRRRGKETATPACEAPTGLQPFDDASAPVRETPSPSGSGRKKHVVTLPI